MPTSRISAKKVPVFILGTPGTSYAEDLTSIVLENEDGDTDTVTFKDYADGGSRTYFIRGSAIQGTNVGSLWKYNWDNSGSTSIDFVYGPNGNTVATTAQPHFTGKLTIGPKPRIGGEASGDGSFQFDFEFTVDGIPTVKTAA